MRLRFVTAALLSATALPALAQNIIPSDAQPTCAVDQATFDSWFEGGSASQNGVVMATDGFNFPPSATNTKCDFYRWGAQMFLFLTSPADGGYVFDSETFYDVVSTASGFEFVSNAGDAPNSFAVRDVKDIDGTGQAGGSDVLISQAGSLTYYGIHANDIYAQFRTGYLAQAFEGTPIATDFPTTLSDVELIQDYAGMSFPNINASTMELKTSWVDASTVPDPENYVVIQAEVPAFTRSSDAEWPANGTEVLSLAMVGMHIVAPVLGHPELVWISYEHIGNAPMAEYVYSTNASGNPTATVPFSSDGTWTYLPSGAEEPAKVTTVASSSSEGIKAAKNETIRAVDTIQKNPWGVEPGAGADIANNTDLVSLNSSVLGMLGGLSDMRANYFQLGGIWTVDGQMPTGGTDPNIRGGTRLANSTLETFHQYPDENNGFTAENCFFCHSVSGDNPGVGISHIFDHLSGLN